MKKYIIKFVDPNFGVQYMAQGISVDDQIEALQFKTRELAAAYITTLPVKIKQYNPIVIEVTL